MGERTRANGEGSWRIRNNGKSVEFRWGGNKSVSEKNVWPGTKRNESKRGDRGRDERLRQLMELPEQFDDGITLAKWSKQCYEDMQQKVTDGKIEESTYESYRYTHAMCDRQWGARPLTELTTLEIEDGLDELSKDVVVVVDGKKQIVKKPYDFRTKQKAKAWMGYIFNRAEASGKIVRGKNPMDLVQKLQNNQRQTKRKDAYTSTEVAKLLRNLPDTRIGNAIRVCLACGFRGQEILALQYIDIEPDGSAIRIERAVKRGYKGRAYDGKTKTASSERTVYVPAFAQAAAMYLRKHSENGWILPGAGQKHLMHTAWREQYYEAVMAAGVTPLVPHRMRHTYISMMDIKAGVNRQVTQSMSGHSDIDTMLSYDHAQADDKIAAAAKLNEYVQSIITE